VAATHWEAAEPRPPRSRSPRHVPFSSREDHPWPGQSACDKASRRGKAARDREGPWRVWRPSRLSSRATRGRDGTWHPAMADWEAGGCKDSEFFGLTARSPPVGGTRSPTSHVRGLVRTRPVMLPTSGRASEAPGPPRPAVRGCLLCSPAGGRASRHAGTEAVDGTAARNCREHAAGPVVAHLAVGAAARWRQPGDAAGLGAAAARATRRSCCEAAALANHSLQERPRDRAVLGLRPGAPGSEVPPRRRWGRWPKRVREADLPADPREE
jgi:hypothetical protein